MEVADERNADAERIELGADRRAPPAAAASLLTVIRTSSEPAWASAATWRAVASASAVSVFVIDCTTTGWADPTGTPPTDDRCAAGAGLDAHRRAMVPDRHAPCTGATHVTSDVANRMRVARGRSGSSRTSRRAATLAADLCEASGAEASVFHAASPFLAALRETGRAGGGRPRLAPRERAERRLYLATRYRYPILPVIYWTGSADVAAAGHGARRRA